MGKCNVKEQDILNGILDYLKLRKAVVAHVRSTGTIIRVNNKTFFGRNKYNQPGIADIIGVYNGKPIAIEVKSPVGKVSPQQTAWLSQWSDSGGFYCVARSIDHVDQFINQLEGTK